MPAENASFFVPPFKVQDYVQRTSTPDRRDHKRRRVDPSCASPADDENVDRLRYDSVVTLRKTWDDIFKKYESIAEEDWDEIDLSTGAVIRDQGIVRGLRKVRIGDFCEGECKLWTEVKTARGQDGDSDTTSEDELGGWDGDVAEVSERYLWEKRMRDDDLEDLRGFLAIEQEKGNQSSDIESIPQDHRDSSPEKVGHSGNAIATEAITCDSDTEDEFAQWEVPDPPMRRSRSLAPSSSTFKREPVTSEARKAAASSSPTEGWSSLSSPVTSHRLLPPSRRLAWHRLPSPSAASVASSSSAPVSRQSGIGTKTRNSLPTPPQSAASSSAISPWSTRCHEDDLNFGLQDDDGLSDESGSQSLEAGIHAQGPPSKVAAGGKTRLGVAKQQGAQRQEQVTPDRRVKRSLPREGRPSRSALEARKGPLKEPSSIVTQRKYDKGWRDATGAEISSSPGRENGSERLELGVSEPRVPLPKKRKRMQMRRVSMGDDDAVDPLNL